MSNEVKTVLVTGATGTQGGSVARVLHAAGLRTRALARKPGSPEAEALAQAGIEVIAGDLDDEASLAAAMEGVDALFSVQAAAALDEQERVQAQNLLNAARTAGVKQIVHSSVSGTGWRTEHPDVDAGVMKTYWDNKEAVEELVRNAGFDHYTIFKPAFMMENFILPKSQYMFPDLATGGLVTAVKEATEVSLVGADDIGAAAAAAIADPQKFHGQEIELSGGAMTLSQVAEIINQMTGVVIEPQSVSADEVNARHGLASWSPNQLWLNDVGYPARPQSAHEHGLQPTSFEEWAGHRRDALRSAVGAAQTA